MLGYKEEGNSSERTGCMRDIHRQSCADRECKSGYLEQVATLLKVSPRKMSVL